MWLVKTSSNCLVNKEIIGLWAGGSEIVWADGAHLIFHLYCLLRYFRHDSCLPLMRLLWVFLKSFFVRIFCTVNDELE